jgi:NCS1 family nucleobase:cation symporter-1
MVNLSQYIPSGATIKARLTTAKAWELEKQDSALAPKDVWTNSDSECMLLYDFDPMLTRYLVDPVPPEQQTWTLWTWMA